eukprot:scaffold117203_cov21-Tisochrysis_lutea.AAC.1
MQDQAVVDAILQRKKPPKPPTHNKRATPFEVPAFSLPGLDAAYWIPGASHSPFQQGAAPATQHQHKGKSSLSLSLDHVQSAPLSETSPTSNETPSPLKRTMMQQGGEGGSSSAARVSLQVKAVCCPQELLFFFECTTADLFQGYWALSTGKA